MINNIGKIYGATFEEFKRENAFERLPKPSYNFFDSDRITDYGLRLYCIRVIGSNDKIVILLNGDRKTAQKTKDCPNCKRYFDFADKFSEVFYNALFLNDIEIDGLDLETEKGFYLEF